MLKKSLFVLSLIFFFGFSTAWAEVSIQNDQIFTSEDGTIYIVGEVQNEFNVPLNQIDILATLYSNGEKIDTISTASLLNTIMPGMKGPFELVVFGEKAKIVDSYSLDIEYKISEPKSQVIDVTSSEVKWDNFDNLVISGMVANRGETTANTISVVATLYDRDGKVAAVSKVHTEPDYLRANDETFFLLAIPDEQHANSIVDYSLVAESEEYSAVPEFPFGSTFLLAASVFVYIIFTKYSTRFITNLFPALNLR